MKRYRPNREAPVWPIIYTLDGAEERALAVAADDRWEAARMGDRYLEEHYPERSSGGAPHGYDQIGTAEHGSIVEIELPLTPWFVSWEAGGERMEGYVLARSKRDANLRVYALQHEKPGYSHVRDWETTEADEGEVAGMQLSRDRIAPRPLRLRPTEREYDEKDNPVSFDGDIVGIVVNPKLGRPLLVVASSAHVGIRRMDREDWFKEGNGYYEEECDDTQYGWPCEVTGCVRIHTPSGVKTKGAGYGTALYVALCMGAYDAERLRLRLPGDTSCVSSGFPGRSADASAWWEGAVERQLATEVEGESAEEELKEENVDVTRQLKELILGETFEYEDNTFTVDYVNTIDVDGTTTVPGEERTAQKLAYEDARKAGLIIANLPFTSREIGGDLNALWRVAQNAEDETLGVHLPALLALDVRGLTLPAINLLGALAQQADATDEQLSHLRLRWELNLDPDEPVRQQTLRFNAAESRQVRAALDEAATLRRQLGWNELMSLDV